MPNPWRSPGRKAGNSAAALAAAAAAAFRAALIVEARTAAAAHIDWSGVDNGWNDVGGGCEWSGVSDG